MPLKFSIILYVVMIFGCADFVNGQSITISDISTTGRFNSCTNAGLPVITANFISGNGSTVYNGSLVCINQADSTVIHFTINNIQ